MYSVLCFSPILNVFLVFISISVQVRTLSKHRISSADALKPYVLQTLLLLVCALTHNTFHQNQPVPPSATSHLFLLSLKIHPFLNLLTSKKLICIHSVDLLSCAIYTTLHLLVFNITSGAILNSHIPPKLSFFGWFCRVNVLISCSYLCLLCS